MADGGASTMILGNISVNQRSSISSIIEQGAKSQSLVEQMQKKRLLTQKQMYHSAAIEGMYLSIQQELIKK